MSIRLHALGFPSAWTADGADTLLDLAATAARTFEADGGAYRLWRTREGAELWFHYPRPHHHAALILGLRPPIFPLRPKRARSAPLRRPTIDPDSKPPNTIIAVTPFHRGLSNCTIRIGRHLTLDQTNPLEGSVMAWLPSCQDPNAGPASQLADGKGRRPDRSAIEQVIVLELAPFALQPRHKTPYVTQAQILCCAHALWAFPDLASYERQTPRTRRIRLGSYLPTTDTDVPEVELTYRYSPVTLGLATGIVRRSIRHVNPATGAPYYWLLLETRRGTFDVVVNAQQVMGDISDGHIAQVCGSFLARLAGTKV